MVLKTTLRSKKTADRPRRTKSAMRIPIRNRSAGLAPAGSIPRDESVDTAVEFVACAVSVDAAIAAYAFEGVFVTNGRRPWYRVKIG